MKVSVAGTPMVLREVTEDYLTLSLSKESRNLLEKVFLAMNNCDVTKAFILCRKIPEISVLSLGTSILLANKAELTMTNSFTKVVKSRMASIGVELHQIQVAGKE